ncbi:Ent-kaurene synthase [Mycena sanguinolenta]|uniref:Ent-kaurene synthase n=1 Tax=Mycena sanguinolenta TaxID=230812 RepID=A0A8H6ZD13_9AGAR|nr:Ent-kaurene synthase [Mycena sanguinolenta]
MAVLCRIWNDWGSKKRDIAERNISGMNFPEFAEMTEEQVKAQMRRISDYELRCFHASLADLRQAAKEVMGEAKDSLALSEFVKNASDESLEHACNLGEIALHQRFFAYFYRLPPSERPCGSFKVTFYLFPGNWGPHNIQTIALQVLSGTTLSLIATKSGLYVEGMTERSGAEVIRIIFGVLSCRLPDRQVQSTFDDVFSPIVRSAQAAYITYHERKTSSDPTTCPQNLAEGDLARTERFTIVRTSFSHLQSNPPPTVQLKLGPVLQAIVSVSYSASTEVEPIVETTRELPTASDSSPGLLPADPVNVTAEVARDGSRSPNPCRSPLVSPPRVLKPHLRASAPSPPSPLRDLYRASRSLSVPPRRVRFSDDDSGPLLSGLHPVPRRVYFALTPPPVFAPAGRNRSLVFNPKTCSRI